MNTNSNAYTFIYAAILTVISAVLLALSAEGLKPAQDANILLEKKMNVLNAVRFKSKDKTEIESTYENSIEEMVINANGESVEGMIAFDVNLRDETKKGKDSRNLPLYVYTNDEGGKYYIIPLYGAGLWGPVWGYISIDGSNYNSVYGSFFDHKGETPGLGAEIATEVFQQQFEGKKMFDANNGFISTRVVKSGSPFPISIENETDFRVDGISGGTITSNGVDKMILDWVGMYTSYFTKMKSSATPEEVTDTLALEADSLALDSTQMVNQK